MRPPLKPIKVHLSNLFVESVPRTRGDEPEGGHQVCPYRPASYVRRDPFLIGAHGAPYEAAGEKYILGLRSLPHTRDEP
jgi:hypothetical protein